MLELKNFRNYRIKKISFSPFCNYIHAPNGSGKTNILEALFYLIEGKSHRTDTDAELLRWDQLNDVSLFPPFARVHAEGRLSHHCDIPLDITVLLQQVGPTSLRLHKTFTVDGQKKSSTSFAMLFHGLFFSPESLVVISGSPERRRVFFDHIINQLDPLYSKYCKVYQKIILRRNSVLKKYREERFNDFDAQMEYWDRELIMHGSYIIQKRKELTTKIVQLLPSVTKELFYQGYGLDILYKPSLRDAEAMVDIDELRDYFHSIVSNYREQEIASATTLKGPHRDDWCFLLDGHDVKSFGSRGQQRLSIIALCKVALEFVANAYDGETPLVLLDDIFSELDEMHSSYLLNFLIQKKYQVIITGCKEELPYCDRDAVDIIDLMGYGEKSC